MTTKATTEPRWLKVKQVAQELQMSESSIYRLISDKQIPCRWIGGRVRIHRDFIENGSDWAEMARTDTIFPRK